MSCASAPKPFDPYDLATRAAIKIAQPELEKIFSAQAPILPSSRGLFKTVDQLPGQKFDPQSSFKKSILYDARGNLSLLPGDYIIPVITYCMKSNGASPAGHQYTLAQLQGSRAHIIRELNLKITTKFSIHDVQTLSWSIQNGLSYEEMTKESRQIVDEILPDQKPELQQSFLQNFAQKWDSIANKSLGVIPSFETTSDEVLNQFGEVGQKIVEIRNFRQLIRIAGNDYSRLSSLIDTHSVFPPPQQKTETPWSQVSENIYARFITTGIYQDLGQIQLRILPENINRKINSLDSNRVLVDLTSWVADPGTGAIQPLSFSPIFAPAGVIAIPATILDAPIVAAALLAAILAAKLIDWDAFEKLAKLFDRTREKVVRDQIEQGLNALSKAHDELEKPLRDLKIVDRKTKVTTKDKTRQYTKSGGEEELQKDFDKIPGEITQTDGLDIKTLPDGSKILRRPKTEKTDFPTLEVQPPKEGPSRKIRIKVRY